MPGGELCWGARIIFTRSYSNIGDELVGPSITEVRRTAGNGLPGLQVVWQFGPE